MSIKITTPAALDQFNLDNSVFFKGTADAPITTVKIFAEQYLLSTSEVTGGIWSAAYPFNRPGKRRITARGFDSTDREVERSAVDIIVNDDSLQIFGIDVSNHNPTVNWLEAAKSKRATFGFAKASEGATFKDQDFATNWSGMKAAGIVRGAYHFFRPIKPVDDQVENFLSMVGNLSTGDLPPVLDLEPYPEEVEQQWQSIGSVDERISKSKEWLEKVEAALGKKPIIYTVASFWREYMGDTDALIEYPLWIAHYKDFDAGNPAVPANNWGGKGYTIWQYTESGTVKGVRGQVDHNFFNGNLSKLLALTE
jgi:lysozyme